ncbi:MAG: hypothetical protein ACLFOY_16185 [Desulfatibacillaceae bacterium]
MDYRPLFIKTCATFLAGLLLLAPTTALCEGADKEQESAPSPCRQWEDPFHVFSHARWATRLSFNRDQGVAHVQNGYLSLVAPTAYPAGVEIRSRFQLVGDFAVETGYEAEDTKAKRGCLFQGGLFLMTANGATRWHGDVVREGNRLAYAARWERKDSVDYEHVKGLDASLTGTLRLERRDGRITVSAGSLGDMRKIHEFTIATETPLLVGYHFKSGRRTGTGLACPAFIRFRDFSIPSCRGASPLDANPFDFH